MSARATAVTKPRPARRPRIGSPLGNWLAIFGALRLYHRYEVHGLEHVVGAPASLLAGYHGRPLAIDLCILSTVLYEKLGYLPHGVIHGYFGENRLLRRTIDGLGLLTEDGPAMRAAVERGEHVLLQPGGTREGCRSFRHRYEVNWGARVGYVRLAIKYGLPIIPVGGSGMDDQYIGLNDGYALGRKLGVRGRLPVWIGLGLGGVWPLALPLPVKLVQRIGPPIETHLRRKIALDDKPALRDVHEEVKATVQKLLGNARAESA